jgi:hypothetical protein
VQWGSYLSSRGRRSRDTRKTEFEVSVRLDAESAASDGSGGKKAWDCKIAEVVALMGQSLGLVIIV